ncbi:MAG: hypothetical protein JXJ22_07915 [Bacteroidales bacterium]|nr:hypothetical protein [Bacteroidales bacterium]
MEENFMHINLINPVVYTCMLPLIAGILFFLIPEKLKITKGIIAVMLSGISLYFAFVLYSAASLHEQYSVLPAGITYFNVAASSLLLCNIDPLARLVSLFICFFSFLITIYYTAFTAKENSISHFYSYMLFTLGASVITVLTGNLLVFVFFWGFLGITLYKLINAHDEISSAAAKKTLILVGASDGLMILGIAILWKISGSFDFTRAGIPTTNGLSITAFFCLLVGSFTKAGAFPFHTWIPDYTESAPAPASAYLPASLDKLLGIYFLARIFNDLFEVSSWIRLVVLILGTSTIIIAVMMALVQHNYKRLLGYHAVSQVGYMVTGIALGSVLGIVGGLFHMVNHALYKSGLFLVAGSIKKASGKDNLEQLGGLSKFMPVTFICALVFALSISGIPPLNGFASKWLIYQGIIEFGTGTGIANQLWILWLALAVIGSALTLASFIKFISGIFLGRQKTSLKEIKEVNWLMWLPQIILAVACIGFGVMASNRVIPQIFTPVTGEILYSGLWNSSAISLLIIISILLGIAIYFTLTLKKFRTEDSFIGGETFRDQAGFETTEFYDTIKNSSFFSIFYKAAEKKWFDIYELSKNSVLKISHFFSAAHNGILSNLAFWVLAGLIIMFIFLLM